MKKFLLVVIALTLLIGGSISAVLLISIANKPETEFTASLIGPQLLLNQKTPPVVNVKGKPPVKGAAIVAGMNFVDPGSTSTISKGTFTVYFDRKSLSLVNIKPATKDITVSGIRINNSKGTATFTITNKNAKIVYPTYYPRTTFTASGLSAAPVECGVNLDPVNPKGDPSATELDGINWVRLVYKEQKGLDYYKSKINSYPANTKVLLTMNHESYWGNGTNNWNLGNFEAYATDFSTKVGEILDYLGPRVTAVELWNEPDGVGEWFAHLTPENLNTLAKKTIPVVKTKGKMIVVGGFKEGADGVLTYLNKFDQAEVLSQVDAISVHPYLKKPYTAEFKTYIDQLLTKAPKLWFTEFSWVATNIEQTKYVTDFFSYIKVNYASRIPVAILYAWSDGMQADAGQFGLVDINLAEKQPLFNTFLANCIAAPTPTPTPTIVPGSGLCDNKCSKDSDCAPLSPSGAQLMCSNGMCVNKACPNDTIPGDLCDCKTAVQVCGQRCGSGYPLCGDGSVCRYISGGQLCPASNSSTASTTYCVPTDASLPSGYTTKKCVARDQFNSYLEGPNGKVTFTESELQAICLTSTPIPSSEVSATPTFTNTPSATGTPTPTPTTVPVRVTDLVNFRFKANKGSLVSTSLTVAGTGLLDGRNIYLKMSLTMLFTCGNNKCQAGETSATCPSDCKQPSPTPSPSLVAGQGLCDNKCSKDSDCAALSPSGAQLICSNGMCVNKVCPNDTIPGDLCDCKTAVQVCGQRCGSGYPLCTSGSVCRYISGGSICPPSNSATASTTYCVPQDSSLPSGYSTQKCVSRDQNNKYLTGPGGKTTFTEAELVSVCRSVGL